MRYRFAREGVKTIGSKAFFEPESIKWVPDKSIPVTYENNFSDPGAIMGKASDLRREDDGWLTAEIEWNEKGEAISEEIGKTLWMTVMVNHILESLERTIENAEWRIVKACDLRVIYASSLEDPWVEEPKKYLCPECAQGKIGNCVGQTIHPVTDELVPCASTLPFDE